jgi:hypothetical protein
MIPPERPDIGIDQLFGTTFHCHIAGVLEKVAVRGEHAELVAFGELVGDNRYPIGIPVVLLDTSPESGPHIFKSDILDYLSRASGNDNALAAVVHDGTHVAPLVPFGSNVHVFEGHITYAAAPSAISLVYVAAAPVTSSDENRSGAVRYFAVGKGDVFRRASVDGSYLQRDDTAIPQGAPGYVDV